METDIVAQSVQIYSVIELSECEALPSFLKSFSKLGLIGYFHKHTAEIIVCISPLFSLTQHSFLLSWSQNDALRFTLPLEEAPLLTSTSAIKGIIPKLRRALVRA